MDKTLMIENKKLNEQVYLLLLQQIVNNELKPGTKLSVYEISKDLNISRSPVSAAFGALERDGFVEVFPQHGTFVRELSEDELVLTYRLRAAMERVAVSYCIDKTDAESLESFRLSFMAFKQDTVRNSLKALFELDVGFHDYIGSFLPSMIRSQFINICNLTKRSRLLVLKQKLGSRTVISSSESVDLHLGIISALQRQDKEAAMDGIEKDIISTMHEAESLLFS